MRKQISFFNTPAGLAPFELYPDICFKTEENHDKPQSGCGGLLNGSHLIIISSVRCYLWNNSSAKSIKVSFHLIRAYVMSVVDTAWLECVGIKNQWSDSGRTIAKYKRRHRILVGTASLYYNDYSRSLVLNPSVLATNIELRYIT